ncbi:MAG: PH domain-containing protein [Sphingomicrobium sp.]
MTEIVPRDLHKVEPGYRWSLMLQSAVFWVPLTVGALVADRLLLRETPFAAALPILIFLMGFSATVYAPIRIYRRLGYAMDGRLLRVVRGWLFHTDTIVPFVRVQHIDVTSGPFDKLFGTASLVVHTAGTHNSVVTLPGLAPSRATEIRDAIRAEIRADSE